MNHNAQESGDPRGTAASVTRELAFVPCMVWSVSVLSKTIISRATELSKVSELDTNAAVTCPPVN